MPVRTRFAPSPTGYLHIGGVRTALFCWLFARSNHGQFILRIDDTDQQRNVDEALAPILHGLRWLGIDWDEGPEVGGPHGPYYQSQRSHLYQAAVEELLGRGAAYHDYGTPEELQVERAAAQREGRPFLYSRRFMAETAAGRAAFESQGRRPVVRLKMPRAGTLVIPDLIRGNVEIQWAQEQDHVIQRTDGSCLYHLANVVDDQAFAITHVIRAEEHLSNTARQVFITQSLGYPLPQYAHLPFVAEPGSKNKLSKRKLDKYLKNPDFLQLVKHGQKVLGGLERASHNEGEPPAQELNPVMVDFYERVGYLPEAIINYLALLGWSLDDKRELFSRQELIENFSLDRVNKAPASFDPKKLWSFQERYMQALASDKKVTSVLPFLERASLAPSPASDDVRARVAQIVRAAGDRIKTAGDILDYDFLLLGDDRLAYDAKALAQWVHKPEALARLRKLSEGLAAAPSFDAAALEQWFQEFVRAEGIEMGQIVQTVRVAVTGKAIGFGLFDTLAILGRDHSRARIEQTLREPVGNSRDTR
ncbi:MAG: glutamate--tRNA ligase [Thermoguttaceae bacterium]|jgi:glutamyl-tRNA synthetase